VLVGPEVGFLRSTGTAVQHDLSGLPDVSYDLRPTAWALGVGALARWRTLAAVTAYLGATAGGALAYEPKLGASPRPSALLRPAAGVEWPSEADFFFFVEAAYALYLGSPKVQVNNLNPWGEPVPADVAVPLRGLEASLGVALAF
jgi:hypothetical protein